MNQNGGSIVWILDADPSRFIQAMQDAERQADNTAGTIDKSLTSGTQNASNRLSELASTVASVGWKLFQVGALAASGALVSLATKGITSGFQLQQLQLQMEGLTKSFELGSKAIAGAYEYAQNAPFQLVSVAQATKTMVAFGISVDESVGYLSLLGDISITSGVPIEHLASIFGRVGAQGRLLGGDIQQLTENGIGILPKLQEQLGLTAEEVRSLASEGQISFEQFTTALEDLVDPKITEKLSNTLPRQLDRLSGSFRKLSADFVGYSVDAKNGFAVAEDGILQAVTTFTKNLADTLRADDVLKAANRLGKVLAPAINAISGLFKVDEITGLSKASELLAGALNKLADLGPALIPIFGALAISATSLLQGLPFIGPALAPIGQGFNEIAISAIKALNPLNSFSGRTLDIKGNLGGLSSLLFGTRDATDALGNVVGGQASLFSRFKETLSGVASVAPTAKSGLATLGSVAKEMGGNFLTAGSVIPGFNTSIISTVAGFNIAEEKAGGFLGKLKSMPGNLASTVSSLGPVASSLDFVSESFGKASNKAGPFAKIFQPLGRLLPSLSGVMGGLGASAGFLGDGLGVVGSVVGKVGGLLGTLTGAIGKTLLVMGPLALIFLVAAGALAFFADKAGLSADEVTAKIGGMVEGVLRKIQEFVGELPNIIIGITNSFNNILAGINQMLPQIIYAFGQIVEQLVVSVTDNMPQLLELGSNLVTTVIAGIAELIPTLWQAGLDLLQALGNGIVANLPLLIANFTSVVVTSIQSIGAIIPQMLKIGADLLLGLISGISQALPGLIASFSTIITTIITTIATILPQIVTIGFELLLALVNGILSALPAIINAITSIIQTLVEQAVILIPQLIEAGLQLLQGLIQGIITNLPLIITAMLNLVTTLVNSLVTLLPIILMAGVQLLIALINGIVQMLPTLIPLVGQIINTLITSIVTLLPVILEAGIQVLIALINGIVENLPLIIDAIVLLIETLIQTILDNLPLIIETTITLITTISEAMVENLPLIVKATFQIIGALIGAIVRLLPQIIAMGITVVIQLVAGLIGAIPELVKAGGNLIKAGIDAIIEGFKGIGSVGADFVRGLADGIGNAKDIVINKVKEIASGALSSIKGFFGIKSPSTVMASMGDYMMQGLRKGIEKTGKSVLKASSTVADGVQSVFSELNNNPSEYNANVTTTSRVNDIEPLSRVMGAYKPDGADNSSNVENHINEINIASDVDAENWLQKLTRQDEIIRTGLTPNV